VRSCTSRGGNYLDGSNFIGKWKGIAIFLSHQKATGLNFWEVFGENNPLGLPNIAFAIRARVEVSFVDFDLQ